MQTGALLLLILLVGVFIIIYKRKMLIKLFSINMAALSEEFRYEIESTADQAIKRMEQQMAQLEYLLDEADAKIQVLEEQLNRAENLSAKAPDQRFENVEAETNESGQARSFNESSPHQQVLTFNRSRIPVRCKT